MYFCHDDGKKYLRDIAYKVHSLNYLWTIVLKLVATISKDINFI